MMVQPTISATPVLNDNKLPQTTSTAVKKQVRLPSMASVLKADPGMLQVWEATSDCPAMDSYQQEPINMQHVDWNRPDDSTMKNLTERLSQAVREQRYWDALSTCDQILAVESHNQLAQEYHRIIEELLRDQATDLNEDDPSFSFEQLDKEEEEE